MTNVDNKAGRATMIEYLESLLKAMRPAFSRQATFVWFVVVFVGFALRNDTFGVSSIVRALWLAPSCYPCLLHFFHSTAWHKDTLLQLWWQWIVREKAACRVEGRIVLVGDHTKTPKDGRRMPQVSTLYQDSETASKPTFFRGHQWACIGLLINAGRKFFATGLWAEIHTDSLQDTRATRIVTVAGRIAEAMGTPATLVLDAFFAVGPAFQAASQQRGLVHILTRAKKNVVAYMQPHRPKKARRGRPRKYGKKLTLMELFDTRSHKFQTANAELYHRIEKVRHLTLDLLWRPVGKKLRFFLIESSRGRIILMTSDFTLKPLIAIDLYCKRTTIETLFNTLKNILGAMHYHFWSRYLQPTSRRPSKKNILKPISSQPVKTQNTFAAIEKFLLIQLVVLGTFQLLARRFGPEIGTRSQCWLRTPCGNTPSAFVTRNTLSTIIQANLFSSGNNWITHLILKKQIAGYSAGHSRRVA
jgi:hypothetical protein